MLRSAVAEKPTNPTYDSSIPFEYTKTRKKKGGGGETTFTEFIQRTPLDLSFPRQLEKDHDASTSTSFCSTVSTARGGELERIDASRGDSPLCAYRAECPGRDAPLSLLAPGHRSHSTPATPLSSGTHRVRLRMIVARIPDDASSIIRGSKKTSQLPDPTCPFLPVRPSTHLTRESTNRAVCHYFRLRNRRGEGEREKSRSIGFDSFPGSVRYDYVEFLCHFSLLF